MSDGESLDLKVRICGVEVGINISDGEMIDLEVHIVVCKLA